MKKPLRIGLIHATMNSVQPILKAFSKIDHPNIELVSFMDEGLIYELNETNQVTTRMLMRLSELAGKAVESKVDGILFTCSSFTPYVDRITTVLPVPVLSSDMSMLEKAVDRGGKVTVLATLDIAGQTTSELLHQLAGEKQQSMDPEVIVLEEAFNKLKNGDQEGHNDVIKAKIEALLSSSSPGTILLAQYSMAEAGTSYPHEAILTGPEVSAEAIISAVTTSKDADKHSFQG